MSRLPSLRRLDKIGLFEALAAQDAVEALVGLGWPITPHGPNMELWRIGDFIMTDKDPLVLAARWGICLPSERAQ